jgi:hypothetical protein
VWADTFYGFPKNYTVTNGKWNASEIKGLVHPEDEPDKLCTYQCCKYMAVSFAALVGSVGGIFAGAAIVVTVADYFSTRIGWKLIEHDTSPQELFQAVTGHKFKDEQVGAFLAEKTSADAYRHAHQSRPGSYLMAALQFMVVLVIASNIAPKFSVDGYFTVDYETTFLLLFSMLSAVMLRCWSPFTCRSVIYTKKLWTDGKDDFVDWHIETKSFVTQTLDLYEWRHLDHDTRAKLLMMYCRLVTDVEVDEIFKKKPVSESVDQSTNTDENSWFSTACLCGILDRVLSLLCCRVCSKAPKVKEKETEKFVAVVKSFTFKQEGFTNVSGQIYSTKKFIHILEDVEGKIVGKSETAGEVSIQINVKGKDQPSPVFEHHDEAGKVVQSNETFDEGLTVSVPYDYLIERSDPWKFVRYVFQQASVRELVMAEAPPATA